MGAVAAAGRATLRRCCCSVQWACLYTSAFVCTRHVPEAWAPGAFDFVGASHQIMHVLVTAEYVLEWAFMVHVMQLSSE